MTGEIFERLAEGAAELGYFVVRFDWSFITAKTKASEDLRAESRDLVWIMRHFSRHKNVDKKRVILAAKSFGSRVAMIGAHKQAKALLLITPNCGRRRSFEDIYKPVLKRKKKTHIVISVDDPYCDVRQIYGALGRFGRNLTIHTLAGDHNFKLKGNESRRNEDAAIQSTLDWLARQR